MDLFGDDDPSASVVPFSAPPVSSNPLLKKARTIVSQQVRTLLQEIDNDHPDKNAVQQILFDFQRHDYSQINAKGTSLFQRVEEEVKNQLQSKERAWESNQREIFASLALLISVAKLSEEDLRGFEAHLDRALISGLPETSSAVLDLLMSTRDLKTPAGNPDQAGKEFPNALDQRDEKRGENWIPVITHPIETTNEEITIERFRQGYYKTNKALVFRSVLTSSWNCLSSWSRTDFWKSSFGHRTVPIEVGRLGLLGSRSAQPEDWFETFANLGDFVSEYIERDLSCREEGTPPPKVCYLAQHPLIDQLPQLKEHFEVPDLVEVGSLSNVNAWFGTSGTVTPVHFDSYDNFLSQVAGFKYVRLYDPEQTPFLYVDARDSQDEITQNLRSQRNISMVNVEKPDFEKFPLLAQASFTEIILGPGDVLYIPRGHWHYVRSITPSFSLNFWF